MEVVRWDLRDAEMDKWLWIVMSPCKDAHTVVLTDDAMTEEFEVDVGLHQGSALSPLLFIIVMDSRQGRKVWGSAVEAIVVCG